MKCNEFKNGSGSDPFHIGNEFGGIPAGLATNIVAWLCIVAVFLILSSREMSRSVSHGILGWLRQLHIVQSIAFTDDEMGERAGTDAVQYLRFQRCLAFLLGVATLFGLITLPINMTGQVYKNVPENRLVRTTANNRGPEDDWLFAHTILAFILFPIAIYTMRRFSADMKFRDVTIPVSRTLLIEKIPSQMCVTGSIHHHLDEAYPGLQVSDISLAYRVGHLTEVCEELTDAKDSRDSAKKHNDLHPEERLLMKPVACSRHFSWLCCSVEKVDVYDFYSEKVQRLESRAEVHKEISLNSPLGMAFVTFAHIASSKHVYDDLKTKEPRKSSTSHLIKPENWNVSFAPPPRDIHWKNLQKKRTWMTLWSFLGNVLLAVICIFFTAPEILASHANEILSLLLGEDKFQIPDIIVSFLPSLILIAVTALIPVIISWSVRLFGFWYKSEENSAIMIRDYWYLWLAFIVVPTFGLTSGASLIEHYFSPATANSTDQGGIRWECVGLPDAGAAFINYVVTSAFIGTSLELLRVPDFLLLMIQVCVSKTSAQSAAINRAVSYEFRFGEHYARQLMIFSMVIMFSMSSPMISPFGLLYIIMKHVVDKHNLAWTNLPSKIDLKVHRSAINFVIFASGMLQFYMTTLSVVRNLKESVMDLSPRSSVSIFLMLSCGAVFFAHACAPFCRRMSPIKYQDLLLPDLERDNLEDGERYLPEVLKGSIVQTEKKEETSEILVDLTVKDEEDVVKYGTFIPPKQ